MSSAGHTNAPVIMAGEKAAALIAADHGISLREHVAPGVNAGSGEPPVVTAVA